ncbi:unnamed protein product [Danaus chrysippus]|uniref:(African queen) hypothetical protein n=1 Tax=Danaus chrysippus TaxID=151541 RepID=A0A8J2VR34_9NEOP|nr:unnamed protein product [Danaus chrysippus]
MYVELVRALHLVGKLVSPGCAWGSSTSQRRPRRKNCLTQISEAVCHSPDPVSFIRLSPSVRLRSSKVVAAAAGCGALAATDGACTHHPPPTHPITLTPTHPLHFNDTTD